MTELDAVRLHFSPEGLALLNAVLAGVMFGIALDLDFGAFRAVWSRPRAPLTGLACQFLLFPAATFGLVRVLHPPPSVALGMLLVAACPGGNMSNFLTHYAKGNTALSITLTALSTLAALVMTPLNVALWGSLGSDTRALLQTVRLDAGEMLTTFLVIVLLPLVAGRVVAGRWPARARALVGPMRVVSLVAFAAFVVVALRLNWAFFTLYVGRVAGYVAAQDALALALGYAAGASMRLAEPDRRALAIECGIRNSGLGIILIFGFFGALGGMAITAAWWGVWHVVAGLSLAAWWRTRAPGPAGTR